MAIGILDRFPTYLVNLGELPISLDLNAETLVNAAGEERVLSWIGEEKVIRLLGEEKILSDLVRMLGEERTLADLVRMLGKERIQQFLDKLPSPQNGNPS